ncbi:hypothetical protein jhhlp_008057 [Lomentospora prolificans]|uniref:ATP-dependent RNA helicase n=1 Tax=Lomentospora prolificans TaxID=41688 RepID=A0A2N3MZE7_9PEZI|nr:hypothetical protein jhhlp_008057 [Lomentospora prolificans]
MYARYIPPAKSKPKPRADEAQQSHDDAPNGYTNGEETVGAVGIAAPAPPVPSDSFSYARYVPKAKQPSASGVNGEVGRKRKWGGDDQEIDDEKTSEENRGLLEKENVARTEEPSPEPVLRVEPETKKKSKKEKKAKRKDGDAEEDVSMLDAGDMVVEKVEVLPEVDEKEERRRRKEEKRKRKEEQGERKRRKAGGEETPVAAAQDEDVAMTAPLAETENSTLGAEETKEKKEKKEKKKKRKEAKEEVEATEANEAVAKAHKSVLDKKEKAMRNIQFLPPEALVKQPKTLADGEGEPEPVETHGLEPLPQPEPVDFSAIQPTFDALPSWISEPIRVEEGTRVPFTDLGISEKVARSLEARGYKDAFAVQTAAIPLLLPTAKRLQGDVLISAATGSGKTLAYAIPIVKDLSQGVVTRLRALVVLPTRELVKQAKEAFETCASAFDGQGRKRVRIGIAYGSQAIKAEQNTLVEREQRYDPAAYRTAEGEDSTDSLATEDDAIIQRQRIIKGTLPDHVLSFNSTVDVLICTPGRLVDHIQQTQGFSLDYLRWLIIDEGDKLLEQNYQNWIPVVMNALKATESTSSRILGARDFPNSHLSGVRKVFLSATLTSKGSLAAMGELELRRPQLVVLGGRKGKTQAEHVLPESLQEATIRLKDENLKPLFLHELLMSSHMRATTEPELKTATPASSSSSSSSDSDSDSGSDSDSDTEAPKADLFPTTALIFTKSNESALRLSRLLTLLNPSLAPILGTLTSATPPHTRRRTISLFTTRRIRLLVASDLVARGIDLPRLDHVVNYDLPPSVEAYVHRVGRTARAGRKGWAWTLVPDGKEGGWFWGEVVRGKRISRTEAVQRVRLAETDGEVGEDRIEVYERALAELAKEASAGGKKR